MTFRDYSSDNRETRRKRLLLLCNGTVQHTTGRLFEAMARRLSDNYEVHLELRSFPTGITNKIAPFIATELANCRRLLRYDILMVHSALTLSLITMVWAKLTGRRIVAFVWDFYPVPGPVESLSRIRILKRIYGAIEAFAYKLADVICVPTADYATSEALAGFYNVRVLPLWACDSRQSPAPKSRPAERIHVAFAGQVNAIRALEKSAQSITKQHYRKIVLELFSKDKAPATLAEPKGVTTAFELKCNGFVDPGTLNIMLGTMDYGLVSIDRNFPLPAFPSKILTYLSAGIPILYDGPPMPGIESTLEKYRIGLTSAQFVSMSNVELRDWRSGFINRRNIYLDVVNREWNNFVKIL